VIGLESGSLEANIGFSSYTSWGKQKLKGVRERCAYCLCINSFKQLLNCLFIKLFCFPNTHKHKKNSQKPMKVKIELDNSFPFFHERIIEKILKFVSDVMHSGSFSKLNIAAYTFLNVLFIFHGVECFANCMVFTVITSNTHKIFVSITKKIYIILIYIKVHYNC
jgi:hypothetical protein